MPRRSKIKDPSGRSALDLLADIRGHRLSPQSLDAPTRREVAGCLVAEGASTSEIASLLGVSDRTIRRDVEQIRRENALRAGDDFPEQFAGELYETARIEIGRLRRVSRDKNADAPARIAASTGAFEIMNNLASTLKSLGFLPSATQRLHADLTHSFGPGQTFEDVRREVDRLSALPPASEEQARALADLGEVAQRVRSVASDASPKTSEEGDR